MPRSDRRTDVSPGPAAARQPGPGQTGHPPAILTDHAAAMMQALLMLPPSPIGLQAFVPGFAPKARNLSTALADGRLRAVQGLARAALRRVAIGSGRRRTMTSKIAIEGLGALTAGAAQPASR